MKIALLIALVIGIWFLFKFFVGNLESLILDIKKGKNKSILHAAVENLDFVEVFEEYKEAVLQYEIQSYEDAKKSLMSREMDFGLFDQNNVSNLPNELAKVSRYQIGEATDYLEDPNISFPNLVLVTHKKNMHKLLDLGIINSSRS